MVSKWYHSSWWSSTSGGLFTIPVLLREQNFLQIHHRDIGNWGSVAISWRFNGLKVRRLTDGGLIQNAYSYHRCSRPKGSACKPCILMFIINTFDIIPLIEQVSMLSANCRFFHPNCWWSILFWGHCSSQCSEWSIRYGFKTPFRTKYRLAISRILSSSSTNRIVSFFRSSIWLFPGNTIEFQRWHAYQFLYRRIV